MKFILEIELGNEAMKTGMDIATALERVASRFHNNYPFAEDLPGLVRGIMDANGNTVGSWKIEE